MFYISSKENTNTWLYAIFFTILLFAVFFISCVYLTEVDNKVSAKNQEVNKIVKENINQDNDINKSKTKSKDYFKYCGQQHIFNATVAVYEDSENIIYIAKSDSSGSAVISSIKIRNDYKSNKSNSSNNYFKYYGEQDMLNTKIAVYEDAQHGVMMYLSHELSSSGMSISTNYKN